jgi:hypothetical protein
MYSISNRLHAIAFQSLVVLGLLSVACHITGRYILFQPEIKATFNVDSYPQFFYENKENNWYKPNWDYLQAMFTMKVQGLNTFNNWNLKQLFVFVVADFEGDNGKNSQIIWDRIIQRKDYKITDDLSISRQALKYAIRDVYKSLSNRTIKVSLWVDFMPIFGIISRVVSSDAAKVRRMGDQGSRSLHSYSEVIKRLLRFTSPPSMIICWHLPPLKFLNSKKIGFFDLKMGFLDALVSFQ